MIVALDADNIVVGYFSDEQLSIDNALSSIKARGCPAVSAEYIADTEAVIAQICSVGVYFDPELRALLPRPVLPYQPPFIIAGDGSEIATISGLPDEAEVEVSGHRAGCVSDGKFSMTAATPGTYQVLVKKPPYLPRVFIVEAS